MLIRIKWVSALDDRFDANKIPDLPGSEDPREFVSGRRFVAVSLYGA